MSSLEQMYQQVILDHAHHPHGRGLSAPVVSGDGAIGESHQTNPVCGDEVTMRVAVDDGRIVDLSWEGQGCSISQASVSVLHDLVAGATLAEAETAGEAFRTMLDGRGEAPEPEVEETLGDAIAFVGVGRYPARIKCALIGWMALKDALLKARKEEP